MSEKNLTELQWDLEKHSAQIESWVYAMQSTPMSSIGAPMLLGVLRDLVDATAQLIDRVYSLEAHTGLNWDVD